MCVGLPPGHGAHMGAGRAADSALRLRAVSQLRKINGTVNPSRAMMGVYQLDAKIMLIDAQMSVLVFIIVKI